MAGVVIKVDFQRGVTDAVLARAANPQPVLERWPNLIRTGPDGVETQIATRTYHGPRGESRPWVEPPYVTGGLPIQAVQSEQVLWDAAMGRGPAAVTQVGANFAAIGVDDSIIHVLAAAFGNGITAPPEAAYFRTVTGGWDQRTTPANVIPYKPAVVGRPGTRRGSADQRSRYKPRNITAVTVKFAMWWYLGLTYDYWLTESELLAGVPTPPKNIGISRRVLDTARDWMGVFIATGRLEAAA